MTTGLFTEYHRRLQDKYDELKAAGKLPDTFEKEWLERLSTETRDSLDRIGIILTRIEDREMHCGHCGRKRRPRA